MSLPGAGAHGDPGAPGDPAAVAALLRERAGGRTPRLGIVLGSGLGGLADVLEEAVAVPYAEIPGFPTSTVAGHAGRFLCLIVPHLGYGSYRFHARCGTGSIGRSARFLAGVGREGDRSTT